MSSAAVLPSSVCSPFSMRCATCSAIPLKRSSTGERVVPTDDPGLRKQPQQDSPNSTTVNAKHKSSFVICNPRHVPQGIEKGGRKSDVQMITSCKLYRTELV